VARKEGEAGTAAVKVEQLGDRQRVAGSFAVGDPCLILSAERLLRVSVW